uniref:Uncharacterized protein MANES_11G113400 n=1 Tax=Rhizophora mucronata TaxID=61149 RepID=A0A2P2QQ40_RHIMU
MYISSFIMLLRVIKDAFGTSYNKKNISMPVWPPSLPPLNQKASSHNDMLPNIMMSVCIGRYSFPVPRGVSEPHFEGL